MVAFARPVGVEQGGQDAGGEGGPAAVVDRIADLGWRSVGVAGLLAETAGGGEDACQAGAHRIRTGGAVGRRGRHHEPRVAVEKVAGTKAEPGHHTGPEVVHDDVDLAGEPLHQGDTLRLGEVDLH